MKMVSDAYKKGMASTLRERSFVRVSFGNVDVDASRDGVWTSAAGQTGWSEVETLDYSYLYGETVATLELNRWVLGGSQIILPAQSGAVNDGFISAAMSDSDGDFSASPTMTRQFSKTRIFRGITLTFDTRTNEWPLSLRADFWASGALVDSKTVAPEGNTASIETEVEGVDRVDVTFLKMLPFRRPRVECAIYGVGEVFTGDDLIEVSQSTDIDPLSRRLPNEKLSFTVIDYERRYDPDNPRGIYKYVEENSPVSVQYGYNLGPNGPVEWVKPDKYLLDGKPTVRSCRAVFSATGLIGRMSGTYYKDTVGTKSLYSLAESVLEDAGLTLTELGGHPWDIDDSLKTMYTSAVLPIATHMNCLQLIAHAACCRLFTDDDNIIHLKPFGVTIGGIYSGTVTDNGHTSWSEWETVGEGAGSAYTVATLELNRWVLDGKNQVILSGNEDNGYVSSQQAGADGSFAVNPVFVKHFDVPHDLPVVKIRFDDVLEEYPLSLRVRYYRQSTLLDTQNVAGITQREITVSSVLAENVTDLEITVLSVLPYYRARVSRLYFRETDFTLDFHSITQGTQVVTKIESLKAVNVSKYSYTAQENRSVVFQGETNETALHAEFTSLARDVQISVTGGTLVSSNIYGRAADMVLSAGTKTITITGIPLTESASVVSFPVGSDGETDREENPLITSDSLASALASHVADYLKLRNTYDAEYRGNPELEAGDIIGLQTLYTNEMDALVLVDNLTFNGALSGSVKVKGLIDAGSYEPIVNPKTPSQVGTLVYNGQEQSPEWKNYDPDKLTAGGTLAATNAGTYTAQFTPKAGYEWRD